MLVIPPFTCIHKAKEQHNTRQATQNPQRKTHQIVPLLNANTNWHQLAFHFFTFTNPLTNDFHLLKVTFKAIRSPCNSVYKL